MITSKVESNECYWGWVKTIASKEESNDCDARFGKKSASKVEFQLRQKIPIRKNFIHPW